MSPRKYEIDIEKSYAEQFEKWVKATRKLNKDLAVYTKFFSINPNDSNSSAIDKATFGRVIKSLPANTPRIYALFRVIGVLYLFGDNLATMP
jgi:hypothetical protein